MGHFSSKMSKEWPLQSMAIVIGPYWTNFCSEKLSTIGNIGFQQDGVTCHTAKATLDVLRPVFEDCIIIRRANVVWPPRSCDLTLLDYHLWRVVNRQVLRREARDNWRFIGKYSWSHCVYRDRVWYNVGMACRSSHLNEIIFHY